ncbi:MAG: cell division protein FtsB [Gammaproteobacteria bacterium]
MKLVNAFLLLLLVLIHYGLWAGQSSLGVYFELKESVSQQTQENERNKARNDVLYAEINDLKNGREAIEERARNDLGMIREGEVFYRVIE